MRLEIGCGEHPEPGYDVHTDVLPLRGVAVVCQFDRLPFADASFDALRANHVLEHQSYELVEDTLREWARVLVAGAEVNIGVPDARFIARRWVDGELSTRDANYWILGGHSDREAHRGVTDRGVPRWLYNAHHTMFDATWLSELMQQTGFVDVDIFCYDVRNLRCLCRRAGPGRERNRPRGPRAKMSSPRAAFVSFRFGGFDGVSVEAAKWQWALERLGFDCYRVAGELHDGPNDGDIRVPWLALDGADKGVDDGQLERALAPADLVVVENMLSLPLNHRASDALARVLTRLHSRALLHHHDFTWQRPALHLPTGFPPQSPGAVHVTINRRSGVELAARGIQSVTVYNHFDFDAPPADRRQCRAALGLRSDDVLVVHPVRAIARKNVPAALAFCEALTAHVGGRRVVYWLPGPAEEGYGPTFQCLVEAADVAVMTDGQVADRAGLYAACDAVVFPSTWEGFGNPVVESVWARRPVAVGWYPVLDELLDFGLRLWSVDRPAEVATALTAPDEVLYEANLAAARTHLSLSDLPARLATLCGQAGL